MEKDAPAACNRLPHAHKRCLKIPRGAVVARHRETGYHAHARWPASDFKHGEQIVLIILEGFKWH